MMPSTGLVPTKYRKNPALGRWVSTQRSHYKSWQEEGEEHSLNPEKIRQLEAVGFVWSASST